MFSNLLLRISCGRGNQKTKLAGLSAVRSIHAKWVPEHSSKLQPITSSTFAYLRPATLILFLHNCFPCFFIWLSHFSLLSYLLFANIGLLWTSQLTGSFLPCNPPSSRNPTNVVDLQGFNALVGFYCFLVVSNTPLPQSHAEAENWRSFPWIMGFYSEKTDTKTSSRCLKHVTV